MDAGGRFFFRLHDGPLQGDWAQRAVAGEDAGCILVFHGTVRGDAGGRAVRHLEYQAYADMVEGECARIAAGILEAHEVARIAVEHAVGVVAVGQRSLAVAVAAAHRRAVFEAGRRCMDEIKRRLPLWKKEVYADGSHWVGEGS